MLLYHLHDFQQAVLTPWRLAAEAAQATFQNPFFPASYTEVGRALAAGAEMFERSTRRYEKPAFNLKQTKFRGQKIKVEEEVVAAKPFARLLHFKRSATQAEMAERLPHDPRLLIVAPLSGHHATLLRGTVEALLPEHDVYVTDWTDAKLVPLAEGKFGLENCLGYLLEFIGRLGPDLHVMAVSQAAPLVLCAVAILAGQEEVAPPRSMAFIGGPLDPRRAKTSITELAAARSIEWFQDTAIQALPFYYPGAYRFVYPGFLHLRGGILMNLESPEAEPLEIFNQLVRGDGEGAEAHRRFYEEFLSVMEIPGEYYLEYLERIFQRLEVARGEFRWRGKPVQPESITRTALLTVEGDLDDIAAPGQTSAAHDLCSGLKPSQKQSHLEIGVGHYGLFNGKKWRNNILPVVRSFIRTHNG